MKTIHILFVSFLILTLHTTTLVAQNDIIADFNIQSSDFSIDNQSMGISSVFSKTGSSLSWTQSSGDNTSVSVFTIVNTTGSWDNNSSRGNLSITLDTEGTTSILTLESTDDLISLQIQTIGLNNATEYLNFEVSAFVYQ